MRRDIIKVRAMRGTRTYLAPRRVHRTFVSRLYQSSCQSADNEAVSVRDSREYQVIAAHYGERTARRSGVRLMRHIDHGLAILSAINASDRAMRAFCLHPLVQTDADFAASYSRIDELSSDARVIALVLEYRNVANATLSTRVIASADEIPLSPLAEVNVMLIADKIQNRADFLAHHAATHPRARELAHYFELWLLRLGIDETRYQSLVQASSERQDHPR